jgi:phosphinothricin acetyltransferase
MIRSATAADADAIAEIYNYYVTETIVTFEEEPVDATEIARRIESVQRAGLPWLVAEQGGEVKGYAYATQWKERIGYRTSVETTVYLAKNATGRGLGSKLYAELFKLLEEKGLHSAIGGVALPNPGSVHLHEKFGMKKVAEFEEVGTKFGRWVNVGYWQRFFKSKT